MQHAIDQRLQAIGDTCRQRLRRRLAQEVHGALRREEFDEKKYASTEVVHLGQLPCWKHLSAEAYRARVAETRPTKLKKSPAPLFHGSLCV